MTTTGTEKREDKLGDVVIIDDEAEVRAGLKKFLIGKGFGVLEAESGIHAMKLLDRQGWSWTPAAIICDIVMPQTSGYDLLRQLSARFRSKNIPIVVVSRLGTREDVMEADLAGAHVYITKPFKPSKLIKAFELVRENFGKDMDEKKRTITVIT